jgi:hypothetical protein
LGTASLVFACSSSKSQTTPTTEEPLEIIGTYADDYGATHKITAASWTTTDPTISKPSVFYITQVDNAQQFLVARNDIANDYNPSMWSQFDWTYDAENVLYCCQIEFKAATENEAKLATHAVAGDLAKGCAGFPWSKLLPSQ